MGPTVYANGRSLVHAGDRLKMVAATPDVCKTPTPGGPPTPVPYPNIAKTSDLAGGTRKVTIAGNSVAVEGAKLRVSVGDEGGTAGGGVFSAKTKGAMSWGSCSVNVRFEGKGVVRFFEPTLHNGNGSNDDGLCAGENYVVAPGEQDTPCLHCGLAWDQHKFPEMQADPQVYVEAQGAFHRHKGVHLIGGLGVSDGKGKVLSFVARAGGAGALSAATVFNFATGKLIESSPKTLKKMVSGKDRNPIGNCAEQRSLNQAWLAHDRNFPFDRLLMLAVGPKIDPHNRNWNKPTWTASKFKKGKNFARPCLTCREVMMAMLCRNKAKAT